MIPALTRTLAGVSALVLLVAAAAPASPGVRTHDVTGPATGLVARTVISSRFLLVCPNQIVQSFPTSGTPETSWRICWHEVAGLDSISNPNGLVIGPIDFKTGPRSPWRRIAWDMRVSDFFVPYHSGSPRYYDLSLFNFVLSPLSANACPASAGGTLLSPHVCREVRDRGLDWMDHFNAVRRGEQVTLWGAIDAANYRYLESYTFRDDGTIVVQAGATGQNLPTRETEPHVHNALWRLDLDVDGTVNDPSLMRHSENAANPAGTATDPMTAIATARGLDWGAQSHDSVVIANTAVVNGQGHHPSYHLMPLVDGGGLTRHFEDFTRHDFWVTPYDSAQMAAKNLVSYTAGSPSVAHRDIVVWYKGSLHHHPRDEDGIYKGSAWHGTAHTMMTGFMLVPVDVFDCSPFYGGC